MSSKEKSTGDFEDFKINTKIKLSALWTSVMFCYIYGDYFSLYVPGKVKDFITGETLLDSPLKLFLAAILMAIPALMIFASVILRPGINRVLNIIFGIIYTAIMLLIACSSIAPWWSFYVFFALLESILTLLIIWFAFKWPKK
ncbi:DUF6326 family protein [Flavobacterium sp. FlaQc-48]|uniref:DUF6326 family protein n=1 Tax=Flavobacterium sp. FlaQc-48 TaxID=3374181 RepID=UPI003756D94E